MTSKNGSKKEEGVPLERATSGCNDPAKRAEVHRRHLIPHLDELYRWPTFPIRKMIIDRPDHELLDALNAAKKDPNKEHNRLLLTTFGKWRGAVLRAERRANGNILTILNAARTFYEIGDHGQGDSLMDWLRGEYGVDVDELPEDRSEIRELADEHSRRRDIISDKLLSEGKKTKTETAEQLSIREMLR